MGRAFDKAMVRLLNYVARCYKTIPDCCRGNLVEMLKALAKHYEDKLTLEGPEESPGSQSLNTRPQPEAHVHHGGHSSLNLQPVPIGPADPPSPTWGPSLSSACAQQAPLEAFASGSENHKTNPTENLHHASS
jgi:hypothetical protein